MACLSEAEVLEQLALLPGWESRGDRLVRSFRFPDFVRYAVRRLKTLCPTMGKVKIAQILARAGLHLSPTTVGRMLKEPPHPVAKQREVVTGRVVTAKGPNHVWHLDLTIVPTVSGFWAPWLSSYNTS